MPLSFGSFARKQRVALVWVYVSCLAFAVAVGLAGLLSPIHRWPFLAIAGIAGLCGAFSFYQFFKTTDEFRQNINRRAVEFAFVGTLIASVALALLHSFGLREISPYVLPALMVILWSIGLFFAARRFE